MRKTQEELDLEARQSRHYAEQRQLYVTRFNDTHADQLGKAANGTSFIDPTVVASIGLSGLSVDMTAVKKAAIANQLRENTVVSNRSYVVKNANKSADIEESQNKTLGDLLVMDQSDINKMSANPPDWWERVDPGAQWRNLQYPDQVKHAKELLNLNEAQLIKLYLQKGYDAFNAIPGVLDQKGLRPYLGLDAEGKPKYGPGAVEGPGTRDIIAKKFPNFTKLWESEMDQRFKTPSSFLGGLVEDLMPSVKLVTAPVTAGVKFASFVAPDWVQNVPITPDLPGSTSAEGLTLGDIGKGARGATKATTAVLQGAAEFVKSNIEQAATHPGAGGGMFISAPSMSLKQYKEGVLDGNILYQIGKAAFDPNTPIDLGKGFFPEGAIAAKARQEHDAALPKINGHTWTVGRALTQPLIKEGYIDPDGWAASAISGLVDGVFTVGTDPSMYVDPVQIAMKAFNFTSEAATTVLRGAAADKVREAWAAERRAAGLSDIPQEIIDLPYWAARREGEEIPKFAGMLPSNAQLPAEAQQYADDLAKKALEGKNLAALDSPPLVQWEPAKNTPDYWRHQFGIKQNVDGSLSVVNPTKIDEMPFTRDGQAALNKLGSFDNVGQLYDYFNGKIPIGAAQAVQDIVDAARKAGTDPDLKEIHRVLKEAVFSGDPTWNMREVPGLVKRFVTDTGKTIAYYGSGKSRQFATMPGSVFFSFDDPISSINDMNSMMKAMGVEQGARHEMLAKAISAVTKEGPGARFELANDWMKTMLRPALEKAGMPEKDIRQITQWSRWTDAPVQWTMNAIGQGYPTPWIEDGAGEIIRSIDMMNQGFLMASPDHLKKILREVTDQYKLIAKARKYPAVEKAIDWNQKLTDFFQKAQANFLKPVAMGAPLPIRLVSKIVPEEGLRVVASQQFSMASLKALGAGGHLNYNTHGEVIRSAKEISKVVAKRNHIDDLEKLLNDAYDAKNTKDIAKYTKLIQDFEAKHGSKEAMQELIDAHEIRMNTILPGANRNLGDSIEGIFGSERFDPRVVRYERQRDMLHAYKTTDPKKWAIGTARDIIRMSVSPEYQEVAKALLAGGADEAAKLVPRFHSGDLRPVFDKYLKALGRQNAAFPLDSEEGVRMWLATISQDILTRTAQDPVAIGVVATGKLGGSIGVIRPTSYAPLDPTSEFVNWVKENLLTNPSSPEVAPFYATEASAVTKQKNNVMTWGFKFYRDASLKYVRSPYENYMKWQRIMELMPAMDKGEATKMAAALDKSDAPDWLKDSIRARVEDAAGDITRNEAEILGSMYAHDEVGNLLYDSSKKSYFGSDKSLWFAFFDAWKEQWQVWMRQIIQQPTILEKARLAETGLEKAVIPSWAGGNPDHGILFKDEDSGQQVIAVPFSKQVYSMLGLNAEERINLKNLSFLGSGIPGVFGMGAMIFDTVLPNYGIAAKLRDVLYPYGDPKAKSKIADYTIPAWASMIASGAIGGKKTGSDFVDNLQASLLTDTSEATYATTLNAVLNNIAINRDGIPITTEDRDKFGQELQDKTSWLLAFKGLGRLFLPGASTTKYFTDLGGERYTSGDVLDDYRKIQADVEKAGGSFGDATKQFLEKWGPGAWIYLAGANTSVDGMQATKEYASWYNDNYKLIEKYPLIAGWLGPQEGEYDPAAYASQRARGFREPKNVEDRISKAQNNLAWNLFNTFKQNLTNKMLEAGYTEKQMLNSDFYSIQTTIKKDELRKLYPSWNPKASGGENERTLDNQIQQIEKMVKDKKVLSQPVGQALKQYWDYHNKQVDMYTKAYPKLLNNNWRDSQMAVILRQRLEKKGADLAKQYPSFSGLWNQVLSREFTPSGLSD